ncbi:hypothetical protein [Tenacibaculum ovolyticum]|uniref:hypothetical protein n=1 Tax=Tenacibaculum ovolyticum TaxID=104270 RepID=UPI0003FE9433|nr:hypothetical protein [Tenacibaculum ovolyticum]
MNKNTKNNANKTQKRKLILNSIGVYNEAVKDNLRKRKLNAVTEHTIKHFIDNAYRNKVSDTQYNKSVEAFNATHGLLLLKRGKEQEYEQKQYSYINFPYLNQAAVNDAMNNFRKHKEIYNEKVTQENKKIAAYNLSIVKTTNKEFLSEITKFKKENNRLFISDYNKKVAEFNAPLAYKILPKKREQTLKPFSQMMFRTLAGFYVSQLKTRNSFLLQMNKPTSVLKNKLPKLEIDHKKLAEHKREGWAMLGICKKTAQNHIKRFREAGLLVNYKFINSEKPISVNFNPEILTVLEGNPPKSQNTDFQFFKSSNRKELHDSTDTTRTKLKEKEIKDCANSTVLYKCGSMLANEHESNTDECPADSYENTKGISNKKEISFGGEKKIKQPDFLKISEPKSKTNLLTENFTANFIDETLLAEKLASGEFNNYKGLRYDYLQKVEQYALVSNEEFKQIVIQDFIKSSAKIWKNHNVYVGEWRKTINILKTQVFANIVHKLTVIQKLKEYRWKLEFARKWFVKKKEVKALFPFAYFDKTRTKSNELGFYGLHSVWKSHLKYQEKKEAERKKQIEDSNIRKRRLSSQKKLTNAIKKYELGKFSYKQLFNYVKDNLPHEYLISLPNLINNQNTILA